MPAITDIQEGMAEAYNALAEEFFPDTTIALVKASGTYGEYDVVLEVPADRRITYDETRQNVSLEIAQDTDTLTAAMAESTHLKIDDLYWPITTSSPPDVTPNGNQEVWLIEASRFENKSRFTTTL